MVANHGWRLVTFSINEVETLVRKAALGAGLDPGRADELADAAVWLIELQVPVFELAYRALSSAEGSPMTLAEDGTSAACPTTSAARVATSAVDILLVKPPGFTVTLDAVDEPLVVTTLAAVAARRYGTAFEIETASAKIALQPGDFADLDPLIAERNLRMVLRRTGKNASATSEPAASSSRYDPENVADNGFANLEQLAHRTYVPASEKSRISGAGAGLTDND